MSTLPPLHQALLDADFAGGIVQEDGGLYDLGAYVGYCPAGKCIILDGEFTVLQLKALVAWMEASQTLPKATPSHHHHLRKLNEDR